MGYGPYSHKSQMRLKGLSTHTGMAESHSLNWLEASEENSVARRIAKKLQVKSWEKSNYRSSEVRKSVCKFTQISG